MELIKKDKTINYKYKVDIFKEMYKYLYEHEADKNLAKKIELIEFSLQNFKEYDLYIDLKNLFKKAGNMDEFMDLLNKNIKIITETRWIKGGETMIKHDYLIFKRNKYLVGEIVC